MLASLKEFCSMGLDICTLKRQHLLKTVLLRLGEVQMTAEEDMKHLLSYEGYMVPDKNMIRETGKEN
jgi:hypothetical protein